MILFLFDCGGTLVNDPFPEAISALSALGSDHEIYSLLPPETLHTLIDFWKLENANFSFPFCSHFLQEEAWIIKALNRLANASRIGWSEIPLVAPMLLSAYRRNAKAAVALQPQLADIRDAFQHLDREGHLIGVASNDRAFATRTMLNWAGLEQYVQFIFTSEGLSDATHICEKPSSHFFKRAENEIQRIRPDVRISHKIYVGDNEKNDIEAPMKLGYTTVRFINLDNSKEAVWLDHRTSTIANYKYEKTSYLTDLLAKIIYDLSAK